jgi:anti-sigma factor RsiW
MNRPTDQELMLYVDGELDARRAAEIDAQLAADPRARAVVSALRRAADLLSSDALDRAEDAGADSIAGGVMAAIEREAGAARPARNVLSVRRSTNVSVGAFVFAAAAAVAFLLFRPQTTTVAVHPSDTSHEPSFVGAVIDVVDFGARPGTIFYVPSEDESTTAVVWLTDDDVNPDDPTPSSGETL